MQTLSHPVITVLIPVYNEERYILETLRSVARQSHSDFLAIIGDNHSTDNTGVICREFADRDKRFRYLCHPKNLGSVENAGQLFLMSDSPFIMWLGAHDLLADDWLKVNIGVLQQHDDVSLSYTRVQWIDEDGKPANISCGGEFIHDDKGGLVRFLKVIGGRWGEGTAVNGVFRRSALRNVPFRAVAGCDHVFLAHAQFYGRFMREEQALYLRREFASRTSSYEAYMERITAQRGIRYSLLPLVKAHLESYATFDLPPWKKVMCYPLVLCALGRFLGRRAIESLVFRIQRARGRHRSPL